MHKTQVLRAALALTLLGSADAFWRMNCAMIQRGRIDTLVNPGAIAAHTHSIIGGSNFGINATYDSLLNSECTSCEITADKSAYWTPTLYYSYPNGSFLEVPHTGGVAYYLGRGPNANQTVPFPKGLNILSGDKSARSYDNKTYTWGNATYPGRPIADRVSFACLKDNQPPERPYMFDTDCPYGMRAQIHYQSCWNGVDLYKADNSHVAYQSQIDNGICPPTHPIQIPHLFLETLYSVANVPKDPKGQFVFSQGDPTGYGFHGDFQNGWDTDVLAKAVTDCLSVPNYGTIEECPILQSFQTNGYSYNCPERPRQIGEDVKGMISKLPGCITITPGPEAAPAASMSCPDSVPKPSVTSTKDSTAVAMATASPGATWGTTDSFVKYVGCFNDTGGSVRTLNAVSVSNSSAMTVDYCNSYCKSRGYRLSGVEYGQECFCDNAIKSTAVMGSGCTFNCAGTMTNGGPQQICGGLSFISIYNNTDPSFVANGSNKNSAGNVPQDLPVVTKPNYVGCATDNYNNTGRTLTGASLSQLNMSSSICQNFCATAQGGRGWQYWGTEYGSECYCGNTLSGTNFLTTPTTSITNATCNKRCTGVGDEICGGPNALSLYNNTAYIAPSVKSPIGKFVQQECLTDPGLSGGRALANYSFTSTTMTAEGCVRKCEERGWGFAGVEYGTECYCGSVINTASGAKKISCEIAKLMTCGGDVKQFCGGSSLLNLYSSGT